MSFFDAAPSTMVMALVRSSPPSRASSPVACPLVAPTNALRMLSLALAASIVGAISFTKSSVGSWAWTRLPSAVTSLRQQPPCWGWGQMLRLGSGSGSG